jgi:hypothetical protein
MKASLLQPALIGGVVMGVLSGLPLISGGNLCCCLWLVSGGAIAAYFLQQNQTAPITAADGAMVGLLAGIIGACVYLVVSIPVAVLMAPFEQRMMERIMDSMENVPPQFRSLAGGGAGQPLRIAIRTVVGFGFMLVLGAIFSTLGGLLGAAIFARKSPPGIIDVPPA